MSNKIEKFLNENFGEVLVLYDGNKCWLHANSVLKILEYAESGWRTKISRLNQHGVTKCNVTDSLGRQQESNFIDEPNFYKLVFGSKMDKAEEFQDWVCEEVLPTIRKTGGFVEDDREEEFVNKYFPSFSEEVKLSMVQDLLKTNKELKPKAEKFDQFLETDGTYTFTSVAQIISTKASEDGLNLPSISVQKLTKLLRDNDILSKNKQGGSYTNAPRAGYEEYFNVVAVTHNKFGGELSTPKTQTRVKPCGIEFIYDLYKKNIA